MMGLGWAEILLILAIALFVIGPQDIPKVMYGVGRFVRRLQYVRFAISQQFDDILKAGDIEELRRGVNFEAKPTDEKNADTLYMSSSAKAEDIRPDALDPPVKPEDDKEV